MKIEVGKYYRTRDGRKVGPMLGEGVHYDGYPFTDNVINGYWSVHGERQNRDHPETDLIAEWTEPETGTLAELDVKPGDVVECVENKGFHWWTVGKKYRVADDGSPRDNDGDSYAQYYDPQPRIKFRIISRASDTPKTGGDDDGWSEWTSDADWDTSKVDVQMECIDGIHRTLTRPRKPVRKTVVTYSGNPSEGHWGPDNDDDDTHRITFTTTDGKPDLDSIKMEEV